jgi:hypothetical protein
MKPHIQAALRGFDSLPDSAGVRAPVVAALNNVTPVTVWRWAKCGLLPKPDKCGGVTTWNVGKLRTHRPVKFTGCAA